MIRYSSAQAYLEALEQRSRLPDGFAVATTSLEFTSRENGQRLPMNMSLITADRAGSRFAGVFTSNRFAGAPILIGRRRIEQRTVRGVLVNNKIANVGAAGGVEDAVRLCDSLGELLGEKGSRFLPASTGVVGWKLPVEQMQAALPGLVEGLRRDSALPVARAIMTTDSYPKIHREEIGQGSILGFAKGAGMIEPNMATMLAFLLTDVSMDREQLRAALAACVDESFNAISVDGDQSTSDMALLISSDCKPAVPFDSFRQALLAVCSRLAQDIVRNGEGVGHVIRVAVEGAETGKLAAGAAKAVVNSPLVKTAVFGNDPNVGRIVSALGDFFSTKAALFDVKRLVVAMGGIEVFAGGEFRLDSEKENSLNRYLRECALKNRGYPEHDRNVDIRISLGAGGERAEVFGADLSYDYVKENADYRS